MNNNELANLSVADYLIAPSGTIYKITEITVYQKYRGFRLRDGLKFDVDPTWCVQISPEEVMFEKLKGNINAG